MKNRSTAARLVVSVVLAVALAACASAMPILRAIEQAACMIVPAFVKASATDQSATNFIGSVCKDDLPAVNAVVEVLVAVAGAETVANEAKGCKLVPITPDGHTGRGSVCSSICGPQAPTPTDPCPAVDAELRDRAAQRKRAQ